MSNLECVLSLCQWAIECGSLKHNDIDFGFFEGYGFGGFLKKSVCTGDVLLSIPLSISIDPVISKRCSTFELSTKRFPFTKEEQSNNFNLDIIYMYIFLIKERRSGSSSFYRPYIESLPTSFTHFPISHFRFENFERPRECSKREERTESFDDRTCLDFIVKIDPMLEELLKGTNLLRSLNHLFSKLVRLHFYIVGHDDEFLKSVEFYEELLWSFIIVWSRAFPIYKNSESKDNPTPTLLPFIDILNHQPNSKREFVVDHERKTFSLRTMEDIIVHPSSENNSSTFQLCQVFNNYGAKGNDSFLQSYGFVIENNTSDTFFLQLGTQRKQNHNEDTESIRNKGVFLKRPCFDLSPIHQLLKNMQDLINQQKDYHLLSEDVNEGEDVFSLDVVSLGCLSTLKELLINKISGFGDNDKVSPLQKEKKNPYRKGNLDWMCFEYKEGQRRILEESVGKIHEYMIHKQEKEERSGFFLNLDKKKNNELLFSTDSPPNFKISDPLRLYDDLIACPPNLLCFLDDLNDEEVKLTVYVFLLLCEYEKLTPLHKSFFDDVLKITSTNIPLLLLYERKKEQLERILSGHDIFDQLVGIREELFQIFNTLTSPNHKYFEELEKILSKNGSGRKFDFATFLHCYSIVERFSVKSFQYVYIIPCCWLFKSFSCHYYQENLKNLRFTNVFRCFDGKKRVLGLYHALDPTFENDESIRYLLYQSEESTFDEYFRKYSVINSFLPNRFPLQISLQPQPQQQQQQGEQQQQQVIMIYLDDKNKPVHLKNLLEQVYNFDGNEEAVFDLMGSLVGQVITQLGSGGGVVVEDADFESVIEYVEMKTSILKKNMDWIREREF